MDVAFSYPKWKRNNSRKNTCVQVRAVGHGAEVPCSVGLPHRVVGAVQHGGVVLKVAVTEQGQDVAVAAQGGRAAGAGGGGVGEAVIWAR